MDQALALRVFTALAGDNRSRYAPEIVVMRERDGEWRLLTYGSPGDRLALGAAAAVCAEAGLTLTVDSTASGDLTIDATRPAAGDTVDEAEAALAVAVYTAVAGANPTLAARQFALTLTQRDGENDHGYVVTAYVEDDEQLALSDAAAICAGAGRELKLKSGDDGMEGFELTFPILAAQPA